MRIPAPALRSNRFPGRAGTHFAFISYAAAQVPFRTYSLPRLTTGWFHVLPGIALSLPSSTGSSGDAFNEKVYEVTDEVTGVPDRCMESHFEYGTKAAWWRIADTLERIYPGHKDWR